MNFSKASQISGGSADTFRYYEKIGFIPFVERAVSGNRDYDKKLLEKEKELLKS